MTDKPDIVDESAPGELPNDFITLNPPLMPTHTKSLIAVFYCSTMIAVLLGWAYYYLVLEVSWLIWLLPLELFGLAYAFLITSIIFVKIVVIILEKKCPPREGVFERDGREQQYYQARMFFKYYAIWLSRNSTFPWLDAFTYKLFGVKVGTTVVLHEAWVDTEFVEIGDYTMVGMHSQVMSHLLYQDAFVVKKTIIGDNCIVGAYGSVAPGTRMGDESVIGAIAGTLIDQEIEAKSLNVGFPARKVRGIE